MCLFVFEGIHLSICGMLRRESERHQPQKERLPHLADGFDGEFESDPLRCERLEAEKEKLQKHVERWAMRESGFHFLTTPR